MKRKNAYLEKQEEFRKASMEAMQRTTEQYFIDCAAIALNRKGWGTAKAGERRESESSSLSLPRFTMSSMTL